MTKKADKKDNGEAQTSRIIIEFAVMGSADPTGVIPEHVTPGQIMVAAMWLFGMSLFDTFENLRAQVERKKSSRAMIDSLLKK